MDERAALVAIMAAIIYAGGDDNQHAAGYTPRTAVDKARDILDEATKATRVPNGSKAEE
jgi:hypothetical protein